MHDASDVLDCVRAQRDNLFYPSYCFALPTLILQTPQAVLESVLWSSIVYWVAGLAPEAGRCGLGMQIFNVRCRSVPGQFCLPAAAENAHAKPYLIRCAALLVSQDT